MKIEIKTKDLEITDFVQKLVDNKLKPKIDRLLKKLPADRKSALLRLTTRSRWGYKASLSMSLPGKVRIFGKEIHKNLESAIVNLREEVVRQIKEYKEKRSSS